MIIVDDDDDGDDADDNIRILSTFTWIEKQSSSSAVEMLTNGSIERENN